MECGRINPNEPVFRGKYSDKTALQRACELGNKKLVKSLIDAGADVKKYCDDGDSLLTLAIKGFLDDEFWDDYHDDYYYDNDGYDDVNDNSDDLADLIQLLLDAGADVNPSNGELPLFTAARLGAIHIVPLLIHAGADVNAKDDFGYDPLLILVESYHVVEHDILTIAEYLLDAGANMESRPYGLETAYHRDSILERAVQKQSIQLVEFLLEKGAYVSAASLIYATSEDIVQENIVRRLLEFGAEVTPEAIKQVARNGTTDVVILILEKAADHVKAKYRDAVFVQAISSCRMDLVETLHASGAKVHREDNLTRAIEQAACNGSLSIFRFLLNNARCRSTTIGCLGKSLYHAIKNGHSQIVEILLAAGADVNGPQDTCETPLLAAVEERDKSLNHRLLRVGAAVNSTDYRNCESPQYVSTSVLPKAIDWADYTLILELINAGADVNSPARREGETALFVAADRGDITLTDLLIDWGADINHINPYGMNISALAAAVRGNNMTLVKLLLSRGADPDEESIKEAIYSSQELLQVLLEARLSRYGVFSRGYGCSALQRAIKLKKSDMVQTLLAAGVNPNTILSRNYTSHYRYSKYSREIVYGESALGVAISTAVSSDYSMVHQLLMSGADAKAIVTEYPRYTALHKAIVSGSLLIVKEVINAGASANGDITAAISRTPLQLAVEKGYSDIVQLLLDHGAKVNAPPFNRCGATALQLAAIGGYVGIAQLLLGKGAEVNAPGAEIEGRTALEAAAEHGRIDMLQLLLNHGVRITGPNCKQYDRAKEFASANGHCAARRLLESWLV